MIFNGFWDRFWEEISIINASGPCLKSIQKQQGDTKKNTKWQGERSERASAASEASEALGRVGEALRSKVVRETYKQRRLLPERASQQNGASRSHARTGFKRGFRSSKTPSGGLQDVPKTAQDASKMPPRGIIFGMCFSMPFWTDV